MSLTVVHAVAASRFETRPGGHLAVCSYRRQGPLLVLDHTEVPRELQGQGVAAALVKAALDWAREQGLQVRPVCSYVAAYMQRHPDTQDLLQARPPAP
jgi:predicted GNAT family acetyltransferase